MSKLVASAAVSLFLMTSSAYALEVITPPQETVNAVMKRAPGIGQVVAWFKGPADFYGVAARYLGKPVVFMTDATGRFLASGVFIDTETGKDLIGEATRQFFSSDFKKLGPAKALPDAKPFEHVDALSSFQYISQGRKTTNAVAYVIFDFGCVHCRELHQQIGADEISGELRWVPVGYSGLTGATQAALAIGKSSIAGLWERDSENLRTEIQINKEVLGKGALAVESNTTTAQSVGASATPYFIFKRDGIWMAHAGVANMAGLMTELGLK